MRIYASRNTWSSIMHKCQSTFKLKQELYVILGHVYRDVPVRVQGMLMVWKILALIWFCSFLYPCPTSSAVIWNNFWTSSRLDPVFTLSRLDLFSYQFTLQRLCRQKATLVRCSYGYCVHVRTPVIIPLQRSVAVNARQTNTPLYCRTQECA